MREYNGYMVWDDEFNIPATDCAYGTQTEAVYGWFRTAPLGAIYEHTDDYSVVCVCITFDGGFELLGNGIPLRKCINEIISVEKE